MPTYGYRCSENGHEFEVIQPISAAPLTECIECKSPVTRIIYPVGIAFKGSGFYKTDSRGASSATVPTPAPGGGDGASESGSKPAATKDAKPAESKPAEPGKSVETKAATDSKPGPATSTGGDR